MPPCRLHVAFLIAGKFLEASLKQHDGCVSELTEISKGI